MLIKRRQSEEKKERSLGAGVMHICGEAGAAVAADFVPVHAEADKRISSETNYKKLKKFKAFFLFYWFSP